jgi:hypothetical protein
MQCSTHVGESNTYQAASTGHDHGAQQNAKNAEQGMNRFY